MDLRLSYCRYRLLFRHPFGTAHGLRDGTDSVFIRAEQGGRVGHGEATLPPYLTETPDSVIQRVTRFMDQGALSAQQALERLAGTHDAWKDAPAARAALHMALFDLLKASHIVDRQAFKSLHLNQPTTLKTVGSGELEALEGKLADTQGAAAIKVKLGAPNDELVISRIKELDNRMLLLDANQGFTAVEEAMERIRWAGEERVLGMEQPFPKDRPDLHAALKARTRVPVYADESVQDLGDLERYSDAFSGLNVKLMKCGGLDRAAELVQAARERGLNVMLGSMSESSLGCTAMAALAERAEVVDLDGPWLLSNDPFKGIDIQEGRLIVPNGPGLGAVPVTLLDWTPIGA